MKYYYHLFFALLFIVFSATAQKHAFQDEIDVFRIQDSARMPPRKAILLAGSSSFRLWTDVRDYFPGYTIINRGFGGSTLSDLIYYYREVILPYHPRQILIYSGENDFAFSDTLSVETVVTRFKQLFYMIRADYKKIPLAYVSMKPSPSRKKLMTKYAAANQAIAAFLSKQRKASFIDVYNKMLTPDGNPIKEIFMEDNLHMNAKGYAIWKEIIQPYLLKD